MDLAKLHRALGGDLVGNTLRASGPGRPPHDRSLAFRQTQRGLITRARGGDRRQSGVNAGATTATSLAGFQPSAKENGHQLESVAAGAIQYENIYSEPPGRASPA